MKNLVALVSRSLATLGSVAPMRYFSYQAGTDGRAYFRGRRNQYVSLTIEARPDAAFGSYPDEAAAVAGHRLDAVSGIRHLEMRTAHALVAIAFLCRCAPLGETQRPAALGGRAELEQRQGPRRRRGRRARSWPMAVDEETLELPLTPKANDVGTPVVVSVRRDVVRIGFTVTRMDDDHARRRFRRSRPRFGVRSGRASLRRRTGPGIPTTARFPPAPTTRMSTRRT